MSRTFIQRTWRLSSSRSSSQESQPWVLWDMGNEIWEQKKDGIRHFRLLDRQMIKEQEVKEVLELLPETPVPFEALARHLVGPEWEVQEKHLKEQPLAKQPQAQAQAQASQSSQKQAKAPKSSLANKTANTKKQPGQSALQPTGEGQPPLPPPQQPQPVSASPCILPEQPQLLNEASLEAQSLQQSCMFPMELWSSLSQWIPPSALYQPSLHIQAMSELSGKPNKTSPSPKYSSKNLQPSQVPRPFLKPNRQSRPYPPRNPSTSPQVVS